MLINLFNAKNPNGKRVPVTVIVEHIDISTTNDGELIYLIGLHTGAKNINGDRVDPVFINGVTQTTFLKEISQGLSTLASGIDWGTLEVDDNPPYISYISPQNNVQNVPISSNVEIRLTDPFPASFIDLNTITLKVNEIDITNEIQIIEKNNEARVLWNPIKITTS